MWIQELQSVDNYFVVVSRFSNFIFEKSETAALNQLVELVPKVDWHHGLDVWRQFFSFEKTVLVEPQPSWYPGISSQTPQSGETTEKGDDAATSCKFPDSQRLPNVEVPVDCKSHEGSRQDLSQPGNCDIVDAEPPKKKRNPVNPDMPNFRATCYRTGKNHKFQSPQAACAFGGAVQDYFGWNVNLTQHDIEVCLFVEETEVYVAIALTRESLHKRHVISFGPTTLRPTIAYNMLAMCHIKQGEVVCDPMCGGGSIPIEAAVNWPHATHICGDSHPQAIQRAEENIAALCKKRLESNRTPLHIDQYRWDVTQLPLKDASVDVFITDMPFGKRSGTRLSNWHLYPRTLQEMGRVCKPSTGRACLLTFDKKCIIKSIKSLHKLWYWRSTHSINIGGLAAAIFFLYRTSNGTVGNTDTMSTSEPKKTSEDTAS